MASAHDFSSFLGASSGSQGESSGDLRELAPSAAAGAPTFRERIRSFTMEDWRAAMTGEDPTAARKRSPDVLLRRQRNVRVVKIILAVCATLCLVALVRIATAADPARDSNGAPIPAADEFSIGNGTTLHLTKAPPRMKHDDATRETARTDARAENARPLWRPRRR
jgi:hypothetical protein